MDYEDIYDEKFPLYLYELNFSSVSWFGNSLSDLTDDHLRAIRSIVLNNYNKRTYKDTPFWVKLNSLIADDAGADFD